MKISKGGRPSGGRRWGWLAQTQSASQADGGDSIIISSIISNNIIVIVIITSISIMSVDHHQNQSSPCDQTTENTLNTKPGRELPEHDFAETEPKSGSRRLSRWSHSRRGKRCSLCFPELVSLAQIWFFLLISAIFLVPQEVCLQRNLARSSSCDTWPWGWNINLTLLIAIVITGEHGELWGWWDVFCFPSSRNLPHSFLDKGDIFSKLGNQKLLR